MLQKIIWKSGRVVGMCARGLYYRLGALLFGYKVGRRCSFYGKIRFGSAGKGIVIGDRCSIGADVFLSVSNDAQLRFENGASINTGGHIVACESIVIGENTAIGEYVSIRDQNHTFGSAGSEGYTVKPVHIGKQVWIGRGCFIGAGVTIGDGSVIGANSVVVKDIPAGVVAAGAPAKPIRTIE